MSRLQWRGEGGAVSIIDRLKWWLWDCGVPGEWLFAQHRPSHWCDEHGNVIAQADPPCVSCGRPRSQGCEDPEYCEWQTFAELGSCDPAAMAELMREDEE